MPLLQGHLAPDAAFIYNILQDATYYFMNVAPQYQSFNNGNWKSLEYNTRDLAKRQKKLNFNILEKIKNFSAWEEISQSTLGQVVSSSFLTPTTTTKTSSSTTVSMSLLLSTTGRFFMMLTPTLQLHSLVSTTLMRVLLLWRCAPTHVLR